MLPDISTLAQLQDLDAETHRLQTRLAELPKLLQAERKSVEDLKKRWDASQASIAANDRERRRLEGDIALRQTKLTKLKKQIEQAANEQQVTAFQHEIDFAVSEISKAEDRILELMEQAETLAVETKDHEAAHASALKTAIANFKAAEQENKSGQATLGLNAARHKELLSGLPGQMATLYERLRKKYKSGPIVAEVVGGACEECQIDLRLACLQKIESEPDGFFLCEECGRVLHYNPTVKAVEG